MIVGFNHNVSYKGVGFHVQTEDSGSKNPHLVTLLYHGGTIISSQKTVYADILKVDNLNQVVEDLAKEQHKGMLRRLTQGEFDERIVTLGIALEGVTTNAEPVPEAESVQAVETEPVAEAELLPEAKPVAPEPPVAAAEPIKIVEEPIVDKFRQSKRQTRREPTLDELIYAYLSGADECCSADL